MTTEGFREVDADLLADYLGGALDGTPQQEEVARLVSTDPAWVEAYAQLAPALTEVSASLARWAQPAPEMPQAIVDRISAALSVAEPTSGDPVPEHTGHEADTGGDPVTRAVVPAQGGRRPVTPTMARSGRRASTGPGRRWREWVRRGGPVAAGAVAVVAVALGLTQLSRSVSQDTSGTSALDRPANAPADPAGADAARTTGPTLRSGTDYTPQILGNDQGVGMQSAPTPSRATGTAPGTAPEVDAEGGRRPSPDGSEQLTRLTDEAALTTCLTSVTAEHGNGPLVVELLDYARFQGEPALVIRFTDATGARWAWVSGPECGVPGSGSDSRYSSRVG
ncbi:hypothetical protein [Micromonospora sp. WMMD964]|uniref:hypothetical protein n=1 Tax=Micromonospora sp. WMMD964 TaxID=3016091 RepID=UPI002499DC09|nr:hypothetical protein [Micromonospora sp. WMMD964]WFF02138.1 hypothetical protein O7616_05060 [Micromonospora sp. WMMD964]